MKLNWGHYILISFILFVLMILYMVFRSYEYTNDLVAEDYYTQEIQFQNVIDKRKRSAELTNNIMWESHENGIMISYPDMPEIKGQVELFRPSDKNLDLQFDIMVGENKKQFIDVPELIHGKYIIQFDWQSEGVTYYTEGTAYIIK